MLAGRILGLPVALIRRFLTWFVSKPDRNLALAGVIVGVAAVFLLRTIAPDYVSVAVALSVSCALYLILVRRRLSSGEVSVARSASLSFDLLSNIVFFTLLSASILTLYFSVYERPLVYFVSVALMSTLVAIEIFYAPEGAKGRAAFLLAKILLIAIILRWSLFYVYPGSFLGTDPWRNAVLYDHISQAGHLVAEMSGYYLMPIQHLMAVITSQLMGVGSREAAILSLGLFEIVSLSFVFFIARHLFNTKIGLLSALVLGINNLHIMWGWWLVAQTAGLALVTLILFLITDPKMRHDTGFKAISILVLVELILTHQISSFVLLVILLILYLGYLVPSFYHSTQNRLPYPNGNITLFFVVALVGYWLYVSGAFGYFFVTVVIEHGSFSAPMPYASALEATINPIWAEINRQGSVLYYGLATIGILSILNPRNVNLSRFNLVFCGMVLTGVIFTVFFIIKVELMITRWFIFMDILLAAPVAFGLISLSEAMRANWEKLSTLFVITFLLAFLMVSNTLASFDSPIYPSYLKTRNALMESELRAIRIIKPVYADILVMDVTYSLALSDSPEVPHLYFTNHDIETGFAEVNGLLLLREYVVENEFFALSQGIAYRTGFTYDPYQVLDEGKFSHIYEVGTVGAYLR